MNKWYLQAFKFLDEDLLYYLSDLEAHLRDAEGSANNKLRSTMLLFYFFVPQYIVCCPFYRLYRFIFHSKECCMCELRLAVERSGEVRLKLIILGLNF